MDGIAKAVFFSYNVLLKQLYLVIIHVMEKWTMPLNDWGGILTHFMLLFGERVNISL